MFWKDITSSIDALLTREDLKLETILNEEDVLQECIDNNANLLAYLTKEENMSLMISMIINEPPETENVFEQYKLSNTVCEIFTFESHIGNKFSTMLVDEKYLSMLWSFVEFDEKSVDTGQSQSGLNPLLASFFSKVFLHNLMSKSYTETVVDFVLSRQPPNDFVSVAIRNISTSAIMDFVFKFWENVNMFVLPQEKIQQFNNYLIESNFILKLVETFNEPAFDSKQQNVASLISEIVRVGRESLTNNSNVEAILTEIEKTETTTTLLNCMFQCQTKHSIVSGLKLIQDLLVYRIQVQTLISQQEEQLSSMENKSEVQADVDLEGMPTFLKQNISSSTEVKFMSPQLSSPEGSYGQHLACCIKNVCTALNDRLGDFVLLLENYNNLSPIASTVGLIQRPIGLIRLEVIHLFVALFATSDYHILEKCAQLHVLKILTDLFFEYQLNNQLHKYYEQIIGFLFQNYTNFRNIYDRHHANNVTEIATNEQISSDSDKTTAAVPCSANDSKMDHFLKLYEVTKILVKQILEECQLIEKIVDCYSKETIPVKSGNVLDKDSSSDSHKSDSIETHASDEVIKESVDQIEIKNEEIVDEEVKVENVDDNEKLAEKNNSLRPAYMGHLRLIANILNERCSNELLNECVFSNDTVLADWKEFVVQKLTKLNELINTALVIDSRMNNISKQAQNLFYLYQTESMSQNLPPNIELLPNDFGQNSLGDINQQLKLFSEVDTDIDFEKLPIQNNDNLKNIEKAFRRSWFFFFDDDDEEDSNELKNAKNKNRSPLISQAIMDDFATFVSKEPSMFSDDSSTDFFEENFANFDAFNTEVSNNRSSTGFEDKWPLDDTTTMVEDIVEPVNDVWKCSFEPSQPTTVNEPSGDNINVEHAQSTDSCLPSTTDNQIDNQTKTDLP